MIKYLRSAANTPGCLPRPRLTTYEIRIINHFRFPANTPGCLPSQRLTTDAIKRAISLLEDTWQHMQLYPVLNSLCLCVLFVCLHVGLLLCYFVCLDNTNLTSAKTPVSLHCVTVSHRLRIMCHE